jgi:hypothetical protein
MQDHDDDFADFSRISVGTTTSAPMSELYSYLWLPVEKVKDPLQWWYQNRRDYPTLSRMALDYLSIPGTVHNKFICPTPVLTGMFSYIHCSRTCVFAGPTIVAVHSEPSPCFCYSSLPLPWVMGSSKSLVNGGSDRCGKI